MLRGVRKPFHVMHSVVVMSLGGPGGEFPEESQEFMGKFGERVSERANLG